MVILTNGEFCLRWNIHDVEIEAERRPQLQQLEVQEIVEEPPENEQRIEEMIQV